MTIWLDGHFGPELSLWISRTSGIACRTLKETGLEDAEDDDVIFDAAGRFPSIVLITKDADFVALLRRKGPPPQVIWLRCPNLRTIRLIDVLQPRLAGALEAIRGGAPLVEIVVTATE